MSRSPTTFTAVLFDLGYTLLDYGPPDRWPEFRVLRMEQLYPLACQLWGDLGLSPADFGRLVGGALQTDETRATEHGGFSVSFLQRLRRALTQIGLAPDEGALDRLAQAFSAPIRDWPHPYPEAPSVLQALRSSGLKLAIITNTPWDTPGSLLRGDLARFGLAGFFDAFIASGEVPWRKPHPEFMRAAARALAVPSDRCLVVGDNLRADVAGARAAGMRSIWVNRTGDPPPPGTPPPDWIAASLLEVLQVVACPSPVPGHPPPRSPG